MKMSFEELQRALDAALETQFGRDAEARRNFWLQQTFPDYVIACGPDGDLYQISYSIDEANDDAVTFGDPVEVETAYVPVTEAALFSAEASDDPFVFPVQVIKAGWGLGTVEGSKNTPHYYPQEFVARVAEAVNGARFGRRHPSGDELGTEDADRIAGWFESGRVVQESARANMHLLKNETDLQQKFAAAREANKLGDLFGLSINALVGFKAATREGKRCLEAHTLGKLYSVDLVADAGAGGRFLVRESLAAEISQLQSTAKKSTANGGGNNGSPKGAGRNNGGGAMKDRILRVLEALRKVNATSATELTTEFNGLAEDKHADFLVKVTEAIATATTNAGATAEANEALKLVREALDETKKIQSKNMVEGKIVESKLPTPAASLVREHMAGRIVTEAEVDAEIKKVREAFAAFANVGRVTPGGHVSGGLDTKDKLQLACDLMLGVKEAQGKGVSSFKGLRDAYVTITGDSEIRLDKGGFYRVSEAIATADFPNILLDSMTKKLVQDYAEVGMGGVEMLFSKTTLGDYKTQNRVRMGYLGDLATVNEAAGYLEITKPTDEKITYAPQKRGGLLTISEETIRNDDLNKIAQFPSRLARAGRRTLKQFITNFFVNNPAYDGDAVTWFHATHNNLGSIALSSTELIAREILLMKQQEKDSNKPLGLKLYWLMVPPDLAAAAYMLNQNNEGTNPYFQRFGANNERIIVNELLTDTNDWYYGTNQAEAPFLEIGFLDGIEEPQIFIANAPTVGAQFTNDQLQYKVKQVFGGDIVDFRGVGKNVV